MKIVLTAGGSGGHFYPLIAIAEEINAIVDERQLIAPELFYLSNTPYDEGMLFRNNITYRHVPAGKLRVYFSLRNGFDFFKTLIGLPTAIVQMFRIFPDVVFTKGSYASVPVILAARLLRIPVFVHDSDAVPGRANLFAGSFAARIAISYPQSIEYFEHKDRVACVGNPIRRALLYKQTHNAHAHFQLDPELPTILVLGGSQGAEHINNTLLQSLPDLLNRYQIIHQVGENNYEAYKELLSVEIKNHPHAGRYRVFPHLDEVNMKAAAGAADLVISRAGSGSIFEIANWELPAILIPIPETVSRDQRENAYAYARSGGGEVIEQENCTPHVLVGEIERLLGDLSVLEKMRAGARSFKRPNAARVIAQELVRMALEHEIK